MKLIWILAVIVTSVSWTTFDLFKKTVTPHEPNVLADIRSAINIVKENPPLEDITALLHREAPTLSAGVIDKLLTTLTCTSDKYIGNKSIVTIIDYSLPSSEKRLWVFDLHQQKLLFHTYVSHGIKSGALLSTYFSNKYDSKASSIGVYTTEKAYYGRHGVSLKLDGLDPGFNDNAANRAVVMHGGWYVEDDFIKKYGRAGRSWGCPAVPDHLIKPIIDVIKDDSLFVIYYPSDAWFVKSKFLTCEPRLKPQQPITVPADVTTGNPEHRDDILFADLTKNHKHDDSSPVVVMSADQYARIINNKIPLERMLRRPMDHMEYIALSDDEVKRIALDEKKDAFDALVFVMPEIKMVRGYYATEMKKINLGPVKDVKVTESGYVVYFDEKPAVYLQPTNRFIRWVGL
jgi:hypothetical protein